MNIELALQDRRTEDCRRSARDRRKNGLSMISDYAEFSGQDRRNGRSRRMAANRRI